MLLRVTLCAGLVGLTAWPSTRALEYYRVDAAGPAPRSPVVAVSRCGGGYAFFARQASVAVPSVPLLELSAEQLRASWQEARARPTARWLTDWWVGIRFIDYGCEAERL